MNTISFKNKGAIDPRCITTIGVSVKEGTNPIGYFGTGLKYAIAIVLRAGGRFTIFSGLDRYEFTTKPVEIRGGQFELVLMNGVELGFTTELGKNWKPWQAMREVYCNTLDEGGESVFGELEPEEGATVVQVTHEAFANAFIERGKYFLSTAPVYSGARANFHEGIGGGQVFYRGVLVAESHANKPYRYTPNLLGAITLTEDRTLQNHWDVPAAIAAEILHSGDEQFIERWLTVGPEFAEHELDLDWPGLKPWGAFLNAAARVAKDPSRPINFTALRLLAKYGGTRELVPAGLLRVEEEALRRAVGFCRALTYPVDEYPIVVVESLGESTLGLADAHERRILLSKRTIGLGDLTLASTLIEEWAHLKHGLKDCERNMQNWLFEQLTRLGAELIYWKEGKA